MSKIVNSQDAAKPSVINEAHFEQFPDAALLLHCFELVSNAADFIEEGGKIEFQDDTYLELIEAFWALQVLFRRKTGGSAAEASARHWQLMRKHLLEGGAPPALQIPVAIVPYSPQPPETFEGLTPLELASTAFNYADRVRAGIMSHSPHALQMSEARVAAVDATTVLKKLVLSMGLVAHVQRQPGETLQ